MIIPYVSQQNHTDIYIYYGFVFLVIITLRIKANDNISIKQIFICISSIKKIGYVFSNV